jgi:hypothetical protein
VARRAGAPAGVRAIADQYCDANLRNIVYDILDKPTIEVRRRWPELLAREMHGHAVLRVQDARHLAARA